MLIRTAAGTIEVDEIGYGRPILQVEVTANGIGDHILALTTAAALQRKHSDRQIVVACRFPERAPWVRLFTGCGRAVYPALPGVETIRPHDHERGKSYAEKSRWEWYADAAGVAPVLPESRPLPVAEVEWAHRFVGCIALAPWSVYTARTWPLDRWLELEQLLAAIGSRCVVLDDQEERNRAFASERVCGAPPVRVAAVLSAAALLVSNDSGMAHVAGMLRRPVLALCGPIPGQPVYGCYPAVRVYNAPRGAMRDIRTASVFTTIQEMRRAGAPEAARPRESDLHPHCPAERAHLFTAADAGTVEDETAELLAAIVRCFKPEWVLETGAYRGGGASVLADACRRNGVGRVITLECDPVHAAAARRRLEGVGGVEIVEADATTWLRRYDGPPFGLIVLDTDLSCRAEELRVIRNRGLALGPVFVHDASRLRYETFPDAPGFPAALDALGLPSVENHLSRGWRLFDLGNS